ncbi:MAG: hypothetical protein WD490_08285 [Opitutales bacterium]
MKHGKLLLLLLAATLLLGKSLSGQNPVMDGADPHAIVIDDTVWLYPTYRSGEGVFFAFSSKDPVSWEKHGPLLKFADIDWVPERKYAWAPGIVEKKGNLVATARRHRLPLLTCDRAISESGLVDVLW